MAAPSYTTDLSTLDPADATTNWTAIGTGAISAETDYYVENAACISKVGWTAATKGMIANAGSDKTTLFSNYAAFIAWVEYHNPPLLDVIANGGIQLIIGNSTAAYRQWYVSGSAQIPLGAWHAFACDPINVTADTSTGGPTSVRQYFGVLAKVLGSGTLKGNPLGVDVIRIGREARCEFGDAGGYATIAGLEAYANSSASGRRWGLIMNREGAYYMQGNLVLGTATNAVDFRDSDVVLFIMDTPKCHANFNEIEVRNASSRVDWTRFTVKALGATSPGRFTVTNNADINFLACSFIDMGTFTLQSSTDILSSVFIRCKEITAAGANLTGCTFTAASVAADSAQVIWDVATDPNGKLDNCSFSKGTNAHHAIEFGTTSPTTVTLNNITYTGFNAANGQNDSMLHFKRTTGSVTVNYSGTAPSYKTDGATINLVSSVTVTLTGLVNGTEVRVYRQSDGTYIDGIESTSTGSFAFSTYSGDVVIIRIFNLQYLPADLVGYTVPAAATSIPVSQVFDRNYVNP